MCPLKLTYHPCHDGVVKALLEMLKSPHFTQGVGGVDMKSRLCIATVLFCHQGGWEATSLCPLECFGRQAELWYMSGLDFTVRNIFFPWALISSWKVWKFLSEFIRFIQITEVSVHVCIHLPEFCTLIKALKVLTLWAGVSPWLVLPAVSGHW